MNTKNHYHQTPFFLSCDYGQKECSEVIRPAFFPPSPSPLIPYTPIHYTLIHPIPKHSIPQYTLTPHTLYPQSPQILYPQSPQILLEWGCDVHIRTLRGEVAFDCIKNLELRLALISRHDALVKIIPRIVEGDTDLLRTLVNDHKNGIHKFASLRSR